MRKVSVYLGLIFSSILIIIGCIYFLGYRLNTTDSIPKGIYRLVKTDIEKNNYVMFCPDSRSAFNSTLAIFR